MNKRLVCGDSAKTVSALSGVVVALDRWTCFDFLLSISPMKRKQKRRKHAPNRKRAHTVVVIHARIRRMKDLQTKFVVGRLFVER